MSNINEIIASMDYNRFVVDDANRAVTDKRVGRLLAAVVKRNLLQDNPMMVKDRRGGGFTVLDGQTRLAVAKKLGVPIYYYIAREARLEDVPTLNTNRSGWSILDYVGIWSRKGKPHYKTIEEFVALGMSVSSALIIATGQSYTIRIKTEIIAGTFEFDTKKAFDRLDLVSDFRAYAGFLSPHFVSALVLTAWEVTGYDHARASADIRVAKLQNVSTTTEHIEQFERAYNYHTPQQHRLRFTRI